MIKEIGSEFWQEDINENYRNNFFEVNNRRKFLLSGRTAIDYVIKEIKATRDVKTVYMPSYCCESMMRPFIDNDIQIQFYKIYYENEFKVEIDKSVKCDIFFFMNYFGFENNVYQEYIEYYSKQGTIVLQDITHSILLKQPYNENADYYIGSLRKWFPIYTGGIAISNKNEFDMDYLKDSDNTNLVKYKKEAMINKKGYIINNIGPKDEYLTKYKLANLELEDYSNYCMDEESYKMLIHMDIETIIRKRKNNVKVIYDTLETNQYINFMFKYNKENDCPLFVPVLVDEKYRDTLRNYLIEKEVFLPIHWSKNNMTNMSDNIYNQELSLVCDHRYKEEDIVRYVKYINEFWKRR